MTNITFTYYIIMASKDFVKEAEANIELLRKKNEAKRESFEKFIKDWAEWVKRWSPSMDKLYQEWKSLMNKPDRSPKDNMRINIIQKKFWIL